MKQVDTNNFRGMKLHMGCGENLDGNALLAACQQKSRQAERQADRKGEVNRPDGGRQ